MFFVWVVRLFYQSGFLCELLDNAVDSSRCIRIVLCQSIVELDGQQGELALCRMLHFICRKRISVLMLFAKSPVSQAKYHRL